MRIIAALLRVAALAGAAPMPDNVRIGAYRLDDGRILHIGAAPAACAGG